MTTTILGPTNGHASPTCLSPFTASYGSAFVDGLIWVTGGGTHIGGSLGSLHNQVYRPAVSCE